MNWVIYAITAIGFSGLSDILRKLGSGLKDPVFANLMFQTGSYLTSWLLFLIVRKTDFNPKGIGLAMLGGVFIALFTTFSFKALSQGPGAAVVMPTLRVGGVVIVVLLSVLLLKEKLSLQAIVGILLACSGIYLLFSAK
ncbi:EamA family transporter [Candidatus Roizmanbacteria bacterium]|nr:EamA family transporter [Candidatus Roizmanbacteria bacterium]